MNELISIIIPTYNSEKYLSASINSVKNQTYQNWELLIIDDCSTDTSVCIVREAMKHDKRIKLFKNQQNEGAAVTRNKGIKESKGRYICFLDADDLWDKDKLMKQINFMKKMKCSFSYTDYEFTDSNGIPNKKIVNVPNKINYKQSLKNTTIFTSTVMFDLALLSKNDIYMPNIRRGQDTATWWKVLKKVEYAYGINEVLSYYRRTDNSLSSNKIVALKRTWNLYRNVEKIGIFLSLYYFTWYTINAIKRRI